jgi:hypothetical protein
MKIRLLAAAALGIPALVSGCAPDPEPAPSASTSTAERDQRIVAEFQRDLGRIFAAAEACQSDHSDACVERALNGQAALGTASLHTNNWVTDTIAWLRNLTRQGICSRLGFVVPYAQRFSGDVRIFFAAGANVSGSIVGQVTAGAEAVWELNRHQAAGFNYSGVSAGNVMGGGAAVYQAIAVSGNGGDVISNWSGNFYGANADVSIPETSIGVQIGSFRSDLNPANIRAVQGIVVGGSAGINLFSPGVAVTAGRTTYFPYDKLTTVMLGRGTFSSLAGGAGQHYLQFKPAYGVSAGATQALDILWYGQSLPQIAAAMIAYGIDKLNESGLSLVSWCGDASASLDCGGSSGGLSTAACAAGDEEAAIPNDPANTPPPEVLSCVVDDHCATNEVCSPNGTDRFCCRAKFDEPSPVVCYSDADCGEGKLCATGATTTDSTIATTCIDPKAHPCTDDHP